MAILKRYGAIAAKSFGIFSCVVYGGYPLENLNLARSLVAEIGVDTGRKLAIQQCLPWLYDCTLTGSTNSGICFNTSASVSLAHENYCYHRPS